MYFVGSNFQFKYSNEIYIGIDNLYLIYFLSELRDRRRFLFIYLFKCEESEILKINEEQLRLSYFGRI